MDAYFTAPCLSAMKCHVLLLLAKRSSVSFAAGPPCCCCPHPRLVISASICSPLLFFTQGCLLTTGNQDFLQGFFNWVTHRVREVEPGALYH